MWERAENLGAYRFVPPVDAVRERRGQTAAGGTAGRDRGGRALRSGAKSADRRFRGAERRTSCTSLPEQAPDLDAIVFGHSHQQLEGRLVGKVLLVQPKNWGASLARLDFTLERRPAGGWKCVENSRLIPVTAQTAAAPDLMETGEALRRSGAALPRYAGSHSARALSAARGREEDTAVVDAIQRVQLFYSKADVSFTALFDPEVRIPQGQVTVRQIAALYPYDNELLAIEGTGKMVKDALENAARFFSGNSMPGFNYDMAEGVEYEIDRSRARRRPHSQLALARQAADAGTEAAHRDQQLSRRRQRRVHDVPRREGRMALRRGHSRPVDSLLHGAQDDPRRTNGKLEAREVRREYFPQRNSDVKYLIPRP